MEWAHVLLCFCRRTNLSWKKAGRIYNGPLGSGRIVGIPTFSFDLCVLKWENIPIFVDGVSLDSRQRSRYPGQLSGGRWEWLCFSWLYFSSADYMAVSLWQILAGHGTFLRARVSWMFCLLPWLRNHNKIVSTFPRAFMDGFQYITFMLAPRPHEEFKIKYYGTHGD